MRFQSLVVILSVELAAHSSGAVCLRSPTSWQKVTSVIQVVAHVETSESVAVANFNEWVTEFRAVSTGGVEHNQKFRALLEREDLSIEVTNKLQRELPCPPETQTISHPQPASHSLGQSCIFVGLPRLNEMKWKDREFQKFSVSAQNLREVVAGVKLHERETPEELYLVTAADGTKSYSLVTSFVPIPGDQGRRMERHGRVHLLQGRGPGEFRSAGVDEPFLFIPAEGF